MENRRRFMARFGAVVPVLILGRHAEAQDSLPNPAAAPGDAERLRDPRLVGRPRDSATTFDNDPIVIGIERRLKCTCGCTLDIYTCRTTDFTCTFSPALHKEVVAMVQAGQTPEQIVATFVAREGEAILMSPKVEGFNMAGYLVPGLSMGAGALVLAAYLSRRRDVAAAGADVGTVPVDAPLPEPDAEQLARLRRALDDVES